MIGLYTKNIIAWYNYFIFGLLYYYNKSFNFKKLKYNLYYFLKWSLLHTLKKKHKKSLQTIILKYYKSQPVYLKNKYEINQLVILKNPATFLITFCYIYNYSLLLKIVENVI